MPITHRKPRRVRRPILTLESCEARILMATVPPLGAAASFAILGGSTVTNTGATSIVGDVGVSPGTSITGFPPGVITGGALQAGNPLATQAQADLATAYAFLSAEPFDTNLSGQDLGGQTLTPGTYLFASSAALGGSLTLDGQGDPNAVFVFRIGTTLTTATNSSVVPINGARSENIFWQVGSSATLGTSTQFEGSILAFTSIVLNTGTSIAPGRALAINGAVTMDTNAASSAFPAPLTITGVDQSIVYGDALPLLTASYSGFVNGDTSANLESQPSLSTAATSASGVGTYDITAAGAADPNYYFIYVTGTLTITPAPLTITADGQSKVYGAALPPLTASYSGFVNGDTSANLESQPSLSTAATSASGVGTYAIDGSGASAANYSISYVPGTLAVTPAPLTITADDKSKVYGAALPPLTASYSGFVNGDTSANLESQPSLSTAATSASGVGTYAIDGSGASAANYSISYVPGTLAVTPAPLTITADDKSKVYGAALPPLTASYSGFVNGDTSANLESQPSLSTAATSASGVGTYDITAAGAAGLNYNFTYVPGTLTITPAPLSGRVYLDLNANGLPDSGEPGLANRVVFADLNGNRMLDVGDPTATTGADGSFAFAAVPVGSAAVLELTDRDSYSRLVVDQFLTQSDGRLAIGVVPISAIAPVPVVPNPFVASPDSNPEGAYVRSLYRAVLGRDGGDAEVAVWLRLEGQGMTRPQVADRFVNSLEHRQQQVISYYQQFLHRAPDSRSVDWVHKLLAGVSEERVVKGFLASNEYQTAHADPDHFVHDLYLDVLGRQGEESGLAAWQSNLAAGMSRRAVEAYFVDSREPAEQLVTSFYASYLRRQPDPASKIWVAMLEAPGGSATDVVVGFLVSKEFQEASQFGKL
ncbi:MBG domain-containing protein [Tundrisphaera lichenicola]|uniref:MBG domain-containing protein n=1 Tax=Tundrisphaera lichenicola TaxID=2029860 RepID=UPI003EB9EA7D